MRKYENRCVGCPAEMGCLGHTCSNRNVPVNHCDQCGNEGVEYKVNDEDYCEGCVEQYLLEVFDSLTILEKAESLDIGLFNVD